MGASWVERPSWVALDQDTEVHVMYQLESPGYTTKNLNIVTICVTATAASKPSDDRWTRLIS